MRSRYSAFALGHADYLLATWHPGTRPSEMDLIDVDSAWTGLEVSATEAGQAWDTTGVVTFAASYATPGGAGVLRERSRFVLEGGRWYYLDGVTTR